MLLSACSNKTDDALQEDGAENGQSTATETVQGEEPASNETADNNAAPGPRVTPVEFSFYANYDWITLKDWGEV